MSITGRAERQLRYVMTSRHLRKVAGQEELNKKLAECHL